ncbi:MAG: YrdB family protein [Acidimicrobiales bacterium]
MVPMIWSVRLVTELVLFASVAIGANHLAAGWPAVLAVVVAVLAAVGLWGGFIAPRAPRRLTDPARFLTELALFGWAASGLAVAGWTTAAVLFGGAATAGAVGIRWAGEPVHHGRPDAHVHGPAPEC